MYLYCIALLCVHVVGDFREECIESTCSGRGACYERHPDGAICLCDVAYTGETCDIGKSPQPDHIALYIVTFIC